MNINILIDDTGPYVGRHEVLRLSAPICRVEETRVMTKCTNLVKLK